MTLRDYYYVAFWGCLIISTLAQNYAEQAFFGALTFIMFVFCIICKDGVHPGNSEETKK